MRNPGDERPKGGNFRNGRHSDLVSDIPPFFMDLILLTSVQNRSLKFTVQVVELVQFTNVAVNLTRKMRIPVGQEGFIPTLPSPSPYPPTSVTVKFIRALQASTVLG